ncbi:hypothetical protein R6Q59_015357 [Mikania micrantha]
MKNICIYTIPLLILCLFTRIFCPLIFGVSVWRFLVFVTFNTALSVVSSRSSKSTSNDDLFEVLISLYADDGTKLENEVIFFEQQRQTNDFLAMKDGNMMIWPTTPRRKPNKKVKSEDCSTQQVNDRHCDDYYDDGCKSTPDDVDDDENMSARYGAKKDVSDNENSSTRQVNDDLKTRSDEFIEREKQRWRDENERDRHIGMG